ncbi:MAG: UDP-N-acetylmuramate dehydrogenase [Candidatus Pacebacteria bacterium]|nr:UDP-N-acetylmuramate dehydrogenase [Candidatus Paceibacterota bacterium]
MNIIPDYDLTSLNTLGVHAKADFFVEISNEQDLKELFSSSEFRNQPKLFLGGGSNLLFTKDFAGMVVLNKLKGIEILNEEGDTVLVKSMGGEGWQDLVIFTVLRGYWGLENLSLIPGTVGAAPMQNIGAYGVELKNVLENVEAFDVETGAKRIFSKGECELGYRESIFKNSLKGKYFISAITIKLSKVEKKNIGYKVLKEYLEKNNIEVKNPKDISDAVSEIRRSKLPDPKVLGNAGSFFKNVFVSEHKLNEILKQYPNVPYFGEDGVVKIPAGWLIEQSGWNGKRVGNVGVHDKQALVIVNHGGATGPEIQSLAMEIIGDVFSKFGLKLTPEVNFI